MLLMLAEVLRSCVVAASFPESSILRTVCGQQTHAAWVGFSLHDLIQPGFYLLVGVGLVFSLSRRRSSGQRPGDIARHTIVRSLVLVVLGMAVVSIHPREWNWVFTDTLTQIGLAYPFLVLIALRPKRIWYIALAAILVGYWLWFALSALPPSDFDYAAVGVAPDWLSAHGLSGLGAHWQKNSNVAVRVDRWLLNLFPRETNYTGDSTGLATLNFIPSIATMLLGCLAASVLVSNRSHARKLTVMITSGIALIGGGWMLGVLGICPVVKALWTPSWVLFSGGWCLLFLAAFYAVVDVAGLKRATFPLVVIGMNSIVAYCMAHAYPALAFNSLRRIAGSQVFNAFGDAYEPMVYGATIILGYWLVLYVLYRRRIFVRL
jgi:heparan-alpha-glucosaminide N-acetyltransferase